MSAKLLRRPTIKIDAMRKRVSLILGDADERAIRPFIEAGTDEHEMLRRWAAERGDQPVRSEASALRALLRAGAERLRDDALDTAYAGLAAIYSHDAQHTERRVARKRYTARTDANL